MNYGTNLTKTDLSKNINACQEFPVEGLSKHLTGVQKYIDSSPVKDSQSCDKHNTVTGYHLSLLATNENI